MVFGTLFIIFMLMHDIKLWIYAVPGEQCCSGQSAGHPGETCPRIPACSQSHARKG